MLCVLLNCVAANLWEENRIVQGAVELPRKPC
jgi:hypothetical protein